jgi:hypothetical protein
MIASLTHSYHMIGQTNSSRALMIAAAAASKDDETESS